MITNDFLFPKLFLSQGRGSRKAFKFIRKDVKMNPGAAILVNSDQGASKTVFSGAILMYFMMEKDARINGIIKENTFNNFIFMSFSDNAKNQVKDDFNKYLYWNVFNRNDFTFYSVNKQNLNTILSNLDKKTIMVIDEPQKSFSENDTKKKSTNKSRLYKIIEDTPNIYKIFLTATPMDNSIMDMVSYVGPMINKQISKVTVDDIKNIDTYKGRIYFIASSVVNFENRNMVYTQNYYDNLKLLNTSGDFNLYLRDDELNKYLNTTKVEMSLTQFKAIEKRIKAKQYGVGGISIDFLRLNVVSGKEYTSIHGKQFSEIFTQKELFEISPKFHFIYNYMMSFDKPVKALVKVNLYSDVFISSPSNDKNTYLFDYLKLYPDYFEEFTSSTRSLDKNKLYYINGFGKSQNKVNDSLKAFNSISEYPDANIVCFISEKFATGFTFKMVLLFFLWEYGFNYSKDSQAFGRISRNGQTPSRGQQEAIILEQDVEFSDAYIKKSVEKLLRGDLEDWLFDQYLEEILEYYNKIDNENNDLDSDDLSESELEFRKRFRSIYPSFTRKKITHNKLREISKVENIILSQNELKDFTGSSGMSQLFPMRIDIKEGIYNGRKIPINENADDPYKIDKNYVNIYLEYILSNKGLIQNYGLHGDDENDSIIINTF